MYKEEGKKQFGRDGTRKKEGSEENQLNFIIVPCHQYVNNYVHVALLLLPWVG